MGLINYRAKLDQSQSQKLSLDSGPDSALHGPHPGHRCSAPFLLLQRIERSNPLWQKSEKLRHKSDQLRDYSRQIIAKLKNENPFVTLSNS
jgi:hypothetical protein